MKYIKIYEKVRTETKKDLENNLIKYCKKKESLQLLRELVYKIKKKYPESLECTNFDDRTPLWILIKSN